MLFRPYPESLILPFFNFTILFFKTCCFFGTVLFLTDCAGSADPSRRDANKSPYPFSGKQLKIKSDPVEKIEFQFLYKPPGVVLVFLENSDGSQTLLEELIPIVRDKGRGQARLPKNQTFSIIIKPKDPNIGLIRPNGLLGPNETTKSNEYFLGNKARQHKKGMVIDFEGGKSVQTLNGEANSKQKKPGGILTLRQTHLAVQKKEVWRGRRVGKGKLKGPSQIFKKSFGARATFFVVDQRANQILELDEQGNMISTHGGFGLGHRPRLEFNGPLDGAILPGFEILVSDSRNKRVVIFSPRGQFLREIKKWRGDSFGRLGGVAADAFGRIWITDPEHHRVLLFSRQGKHLTEISALSRGLGFFNSPADISVHDSEILVLDKKNKRIVLINSLFKATGVLGVGYLKNPTRILGGKKYCWVLDGRDLLAFTYRGSLAGRFKGVSSPGSGFCETPEGDLLITDFLKGEIFKISFSSKTVEKKVSFKWVNAN